MAHPTLRQHIHRSSAFKTNNRFHAVQTASNQKALSTTSHQHQCLFPPSGSVSTTRNCSLLHLTLASPAPQQTQHPARKTLHLEAQSLSSFNSRFIFRKVFIPSRPIRYT